MLRIFIGLVFLSSCSSSIINSGGKESYVYDAASAYTSEDLESISTKVVSTLKREPHVGKLDELFSLHGLPLKRVGILVFESKIQPTLDGLAGKNQVYLSEQGKQLLTEKLLSVWEQSLDILSPEIQFVKTPKIKKSRAFYNYGSRQDDFIKSRRSSLAPDDIFFIDSGKKTTSTTVLNPRGMRDMSFMLVPAYELMGGPKWSEHNKHFINDVARELKLDAVIVVMSELSWTAAHTDKHSGEVIPEEIKVGVKASTLVPLFRYHERLKHVNINETPSITLCFRAYDSLVKIPTSLTVPAKQKNFSTIEDELLSPMLKAYKDLSQMTIMRMTDDLKKTW